MDIVKIQTLIGQGKVLDLTNIDPAQSFLQLGIYQQGNRKIRPGDPNTYAPFVIPLSELINTGYYLIEDEGSSLPRQHVINFVGTGVTATDDPLNNKTTVTIPGSGFAPVQGSFYDTTNQTGNAGSVLTMTLNNTDPWSNGASVVSGSQITLASPGVYNLAFSAQMVKVTGNSSTHAHIWLAQNGTPVPYSASQISFPANSVYMVAAWNFNFKTTVPNEYVELQWEINSNQNNAVVIESQAPVGNIPGIPGLIVTVNQII